MAVKFVKGVPPLVEMGGEFLPRKYQNAPEARAKRTSANAAIRRIHVRPFRFFGAFISLNNHSRETIRRRRRALASEKFAADPIPGQLWLD